MNDLRPFDEMMRGLTPWRGQVPKGYLTDFQGTLTDANFRTMFGVDPATVGGGEVATRLPVVTDGEGWFEAVDWLAAAREARDRFVMVTLGACYGAQAVGAWKMLQQVNPLPCKLVAVEPEPTNMQWTRKHFADNGLDPDDHWLLEIAITDSNAPILFPVGSPGSGAQNCFSTNIKEARRNYVDAFVAERNERAALENLIMNNSTGLKKDLVPGMGFTAEIKYMSSITLGDLLGPFDFVDYIEADIQQSEITVFPPFVEQMTKKVRRVHIGTHGQDVHAEMRRIFADAGWEIVFDYRPNAKFETELGSFETNDGVLTARNPRV